MGNDLNLNLNTYLYISDFLPREAAEKWLKYLRDEVPHEMVFPNI